jgi:hypothetical protein
MQALLLWLIGWYRLRGGGRAVGVDCNFTPTCSLYAAEAIERHGAWKGLGLALARLRRCNKRDQVGRLADPVP